MKSEVSGGMRISWGAQHCDGDGNLISRQMSIGTPRSPTCLRPGCLWRYLKRVIFFVLISNYNVKRVAYAEANRHKEIPEKYRTGEPEPWTIWQALWANIKLLGR